MSSQTRDDDRTTEAQGGEAQGGEAGLQILTSDAVRAENPGLSGERAEFLAALRQQRFFLRHTTRGLTDEQAAQRTTVSELCLGGLVKHVAATEETWAAFIVRGPSAFPAMDDFSEETAAAWAEEHRMLPGETLAGLLARYEEVARRTEEIVASLPDLDVAHPLPEAPWFETGARWSARRVLVHLLTETAQHSGHADILRESLDGAKTMA